MDAVLTRALAAYFKHDSDPQSGPFDCQVEAHGYGDDMLQYTVLRSQGKVQAVFRVKNNGALKRLKRIPQGL